MVGPGLTHKLGRTCCDPARRTCTSRAKSNDQKSRSMTTLSPLQTAIEQIRFARDYTLQLIEDFSDEAWFEQPQGVTHLGWQVGHLAMAQYGLCLFRIRGRHEDDVKLMSSRFRKRFSRGTAVSGDPADYPPPAEIRDVFDRVFAQVQTELPDVDPTVLEEPIEAPYAVFPNKLGGLYFCASHEMLHAGQIGLLRRLIGKDPIR